MAPKPFEFVRELDINGPKILWIHRDTCDPWSSNPLNSKGNWTSMALKSYEFIGELVIHGSQTLWIHRESGHPWPYNHMNSQGHLRSMVLKPSEVTGDMYIHGPQILWIHQGNWRSIYYCIGPVVNLSSQLEICGLASGTFLHINSAWCHV